MSGEVTNPPGPENELNPQKSDLSLAAKTAKRLKAKLAKGETPKAVMISLKHKADSELSNEEPVNEAVKPEINFEAKLAEIVDRYTKLYELPAAVAARVKRILIIVNDKERFTKERAGQTQDFMEEIMKVRKAVDIIQDPEKKKLAEAEARAQAEEYIKRKTQEQLDEEIRRVGGQHIQRANGEEFIFLRDDLKHISAEEALEHEAVHAMASLGFRRGSGFAPGPGEMSFLRIKDLNEATTELLRIATQLPDADILDIFSSIQDNKVKFAYIEGVKTLALILESTYFPGGSPLKFKDLAKYYFRKMSRSGVTSAEDFKDLLLSSVPERHRDFVEAFIPEKPISP